MDYTFDQIICAFSEYCQKNNVSIVNLKNFCGILYYDDKTESFGCREEPIKTPTDLILFLKKDFLSCFANEKGFDNDKLPEDLQDLALAEFQKIINTIS